MTTTFSKVFFSIIIMAIAIGMAVAVQAAVQPAPLYGDPLGQPSGDNVFQDAQQQVESGNTTTGLPLELQIGMLIRFILSILGILGVLLFIYSGFLWMTSGGKAEDAAKAQKMMTYTIIGMLVIIMAYAISTFVINALSGQGGLIP